jgi:hypothetical protein
MRIWNGLFGSRMDRCRDLVNRDIKIRALHSASVWVTPNFSTQRLGMEAIDLYSWETDLNSRQGHWVFWCMFSCISLVPSPPEMYPERFQLRSESLRSTSFSIPHSKIVLSFDNKWVADIVVKWTTTKEQLAFEEGIYLVALRWVIPVVLVKLQNIKYKVDSWSQNTTIVYI